MQIQRETLIALVARASRQAPESPEEHRALADARDLLADDFAAQFPVVDEPETKYHQPALFDATPYEV